MLARSGVMTPEDFLGSMSSAIASLQKAPGRLLQSLEQSSAEVWTNSNSGVGASAKTVSYYVKGNVVSFLLDAHIRRLTNGRKSMDDVMRLAFTRYGGERGFASDELRATVEEVAGRGMKAWFTKTIEKPGELDYGEMLGWYGLRFKLSGEGTGTTWDLEVRPRATSAQKKHFRALLTSSGPPGRHP
jgi:predicted metalloprotease with PDZ domain